MTDAEAGLLSRELPAATPDGRARAAVLSGTPVEGAATAPVAYASRGRVLVLGEDPRTVQVLDGLDEGLAGVAVIPAGSPARPTGEDSRVVRGEVTHLEGYLGAFDVRVATGEGEERPVRRLGSAEENFDLVVDLGEPPRLQVTTPPVGYFAPGGDSEALGRVLRELPGMVGDFEKPRYFEYRADICAHGAQGQVGCIRCLAACSTGAIAPAGDRVEVDSYLCQGCGICATSCPTGAITYAYPAAGDLLAGIRRTLHAYREAGGEAPVVLFHDGEAGAEMLAAAAARLPERVLPFPVEETPSVGMETWLGALAYGAAEVVLLRPGRGDTPSGRELREQVRYAGAILEGLGYAADRVRLVEADGADAVVRELAGTRALAPVAPAGFAALGGKRDLLRMALEHLHANAPAPADTAPLPSGAPFGEVRVDAEACTLCMACVSICPAGALLDGEERPQVRFLEGNCVQCGLCASACPEDAVSLHPRMAYVPGIHKRDRVLHEEEPFSCIVCGRPFATRSLIDRMTDRLGGHWMYRDSGAMVRRLQMCGDCRVRDLFAEEAGLDVHNKPSGSK